jgi:hypothetical protein
MSGIRSLYRGPSAKGYASAGSAPIRVDDTSNTIKVIPAGTGTTEQEFLSTTPTPVNVTAATLTLAPATHAGRVVRLNSLTGTTVTLPAATGSGVEYIVYIGTAPTSGSVVFAVANANDYFRGFGYTSQDAGGAGVTWPTANTGTLATESDTMTWNRGTTGLGSIGDFVLFVDMAANIWSINAQFNSNGTEATPFSAAV